MGALAALAIVLTLGLLAFAPLGGRAATVGIPAAFATVIVSSIVFALVGRGAGSAGGPSSATAIIVAGLVAHLVSDPQIHSGQSMAALTVVTGAAATVALMGLWQLLLAASGLASLSKHVPRPVLAGFMNAVGVLILLGQLPWLLGVSPQQWAQGWAVAWPAVQPATLAIALFSAGLAWGLGRIDSRVPAPLVALSAGTLVYLLVQRFLPEVALGPTAGTIPHQVPLPNALSPLREEGVRELLLRQADTIVFTSMLLAVIGTLETLLSALALDQQNHTRHDPRRVLMASGLANLMGGCFGALPMVVARARAQAGIASGGRSHVSVLFGSLFMLALLVFGSPLLSLLPKAVLAGIMVTVAVALLDTWTHDLLRRLGAGDRSTELLQSLAMVAAVCGTILWQGFVAGGAVGILLALVSFMRRMHRSLLRRRFTGAARPSRRLYSPEVEARLPALRERIGVFELDGPLFFGTTDRLTREALAHEKTYDVLVLDFKRVTSLDESGAVVLQWLGVQLRDNGVTLFLAGVTPQNRLGRSLRSYGCFLEEPRDDWFDDLDQALEAAELRLLGTDTSAFERQTWAVEDSLLMHGLRADEQAMLRGRMQSLALRAGQTLFAEGAPGDRLYVLARGSISVLAARQGGQPAQRLVSFSPGAMLGEIALLDGAGRSATAVADTPVQLWALDRSALDALYAEQPRLCAQVHRNIALHLAERLRAASRAWRESDS